MLSKRTFFIIVIFLILSFVAFFIPYINHGKIWDSNSTSSFMQTIERLSIDNHKLIFNYSNWVKEFYKDYSDLNPIAYSKTLTFLYLFPAYCSLFFLILLLVTIIIFIIKKKITVTLFLPLSFYIISILIEFIVANSYKTIYTSKKIFDFNLNFGFFYSIIILFLGLLVLLNEKYLIINKLITKIKLRVAKPTKAERIAELERQVAELKQNKED